MRTEPEELLARGRDPDNAIDYTKTLKYPDQVCGEVELPNADLELWREQFETW